MENTKKTPPGQQKEYTIIVNTEDCKVIGHEVTFSQIVLLAFPELSTNPNIGYTILYKKVDHSKHEGQMDPEETLKIKDGSTFTVTETDKS